MFKFVSTVQAALFSASPELILNAFQINNETDERVCFSFVHFIINVIHHHRPPSGSLSYGELEESGVMVAYTYCVVWDAITFPRIMYCNFPKKIKNQRVPK